MSYEHQIIFEDDGSAEMALQSLALASTSLASGQGYLLLKDSQLIGVRGYDIKFEKIDDKTLSFDINFKSRRLYDDLLSSLKSYRFIIIDDTDELTNLALIFKPFCK